MVVFAWGARGEPQTFLAVQGFVRQRKTLDAALRRGAGATKPALRVRQTARCLGAAEVPMHLQVKTTEPSARDLRWGLWPPRGLAGVRRPEDCLSRSKVQLPGAPGWNSRKPGLLYDPLHVKQPTTVWIFRAGQCNTGGTMCWPSSSSALARAIGPRCWQTFMKSARPSSV